MTCLASRDEPVRLTRIYTRGGDAGQTSLGDGSRVSKLHPLVRAYGAVDELNSIVGWARRSRPDQHGLERIQNELFDLGADLSVPFAPTTGSSASTQASIDRLEHDCDEANARLPELKSFVLPGGTEAAARLHVARATCRRAEREVLACARESRCEPARRRLSESFQRPALHPRPGCECRRHRAALDARRRAVARAGRIQRWRRPRIRSRRRRPIGGVRTRTHAAPEREGELFSTMSGIENEPLATPDIVDRRLRARPRLPGSVPVHARRLPVDVPRAAVDDASVRRLRDGGGDERALPLPARARPDRACRPRSTCRR